MKLKKCSRCALDKPLSDYYSLTRSKDGKQPHCKKCDNARKLALHRRKREAEGVDYRSTKVSMELRKEGLKKCPRCRETKSLEASFYGTTSVYCIICASEIRKSEHLKELRKGYYKKDPLKTREATLQREYGISLEHYYTMLEKQEGRCAVCGITAKDNKKSLAVDHCHKTNKVRALLCARCNCALGFVKENATVARQLADYIDNCC